MYKATRRMLPLPPSSPGPATKNPSSPKEIVKEHHAAIPTSNSFEILLEEDIGSCFSGPPHHDTSMRSLVTNRDSITSQPPDLSCRLVGHCVLEELATCAMIRT
ncbi:hypothetical protein Nepgr_033734 [Nepenthes gracilis]|uniref:Uncharacterized protein n=1 Tax=Nepenthes gracilis TaxID=150966 RepID=A0AAD3Y8K9_NEPGR|nr:hypothetical protein Nepgr_033734 [Nepenthes gracilis]